MINSINSPRDSFKVVQIIYIYIFCTTLDTFVGNLDFYLKSK